MEIAPWLLRLARSLANVCLVALYRRKAVSVFVRELSVAVCSIRRTDETPAQTHGIQAVPV